MKTLPEAVEAYRDRKWRREEALRVDSAEDVERMVEDLGFCLALTDVRKGLPSVFTAVCGRRDAYMPRNVQKDVEASRAWVLKDEVIARGRVYYAKLVKGHSMFLAPRMVPVFNAIWGVRERDEFKQFSPEARKVLAAVRAEWELATADIREATGLDRPAVTKAIDELQRKMKVVPLEVAYVPKFTYIWTTAEARFPVEMAITLEREDAVRELARCYLSMCGMTLLGDLSRVFGFYRWESGRANHQLVDEGFAERIKTGVYILRDRSGIGSLENTV
jgi:hypothetical protein